jgi:hypothetical protein
MRESSLYSTLDDTVQYIRYDIIERLKYITGNVRVDATSENISNW